MPFVGSLLKLEKIFFVLPFLPSRVSRDRDRLLFWLWLGYNERRLDGGLLAKQSNKERI